MGGGLVAMAPPPPQTDRLILCTLYIPETISVIAPVVKSQLRVVCVNQLTAREGSDLM